MAEKNTVGLVLYGDPIRGAREGNVASVVLVASRVTTMAKQFAPVDEGELRGSIMYRVSAGPLSAEGGYGEGSKATTAGPELGFRPRGSQQVAAGAVGTGVLHGVYQEFGTRKMAPSPFLRPAVLSQEGKSIAEIRRIMVADMKEWVNRGRKNVRF